MTIEITWLKSYSSGYIVYCRCDSSTAERSSLVIRSSTLESVTPSTRRTSTKPCSYSEEENTSGARRTWTLTGDLTWPDLDLQFTLNRWTADDQWQPLYKLYSALFCIWYFDTFLLLLLRFFFTFTVVAKSIGTLWKLHVMQLISL